MRLAKIFVSFLFLFCSSKKKKTLEKGGNYDKKQMTTYFDKVEVARYQKP